MNVSLTAELDKYVLSKVEAGQYCSASEVMREALRLMQERDEIRELHIAETRLRIQSGLDALASGLCDLDLGRARLKPEARKQAA